MKGGISKTISPAIIVVGIQPPDYNRKRITYGAYAMVCIGTENNMTQRRVTTIVLRDSDDNNGLFS